MICLRRKQVNLFSKAKAQKVWDFAPLSSQRPDAALLSVACLPLRPKRRQAAALKAGSSSMVFELDGDGPGVLPGVFSVVRARLFHSVLVSECVLGSFGPPCRAGSVMSPCVLIANLFKSLQLQEQHLPQKPTTAFPFPAVRRTSTTTVQESASPVRRSIMSLCFLSATGTAT